MKDYLCFTLFGIVICSFLGASESLMCFQCGESQVKGYCYNDIQGFINASLGLPTWRKYAKDCTESNPLWDRCMIETAEFEGTMSLFHRGCHDGKTFGAGFSSPRFENVTANNSTTCAFLKELNRLVCYTFCQTNFCNGPQPEPKKPCNRTNSSSSYEDDGYNDQDACHGACLLPMYLVYLFSLVMALQHLG